MSDHPSQFRGLETGKKILSWILTCSMIAQVFVLSFGGAINLGVKEAQAATGINKQINYQAKIADASGNAVSGTKEFQFAIYDAATGGTKLWEETWTSTTTPGAITITNGIFSVPLGTSTAMTFDFNQDGLYLEVAMDADGDANGSFEESFSPRKRLTSAPYAFASDKVDGYDASTTATANTIPVLDASAGISLNSVTTTGSIYGGGYASTTGGIFTQGNGHVGGTFTIDGNATTTGNFTVGTSTLSVIHDPNGTGKSYVLIGTNTQPVGTGNSLGIVNRNAAGYMSFQAVGGTTGANATTMLLGSDDQNIYGAQTAGFLGTLGNHPLSINTNNTSRITITGAGNVGIGTNAPVATLHVAGTTYLAGNASTTGTLVVNATAGSSIWNSATNTLTVVGSGLFTGNLNVGGNATTTGRLVIGSTNPTNDFGKLWVGGDIYNSGSASTTGSLYVGGQVGIGTASPTQRLSVGAGGAGSTNEIIAINSGASGVSGTYYYQNSVVKGLFGLAGGPDHLITGSVQGDFNIRNSQRMLFSANAGDTAQMALTAGGYLGIGTVAPVANLHVAGTTMLAGNASTTGTLVVNATAGSSIWNSATNTLTVVGSGLFTSNLNIGGNATTSGRLVLGSTNPTNNFGKLWVGGDIYASGSASTTGSLYVGGQVGIGTTNPLNILGIKGGTLNTGTASTYALGVGNNNQQDILLGSDASYAYIQSWNSLPLYINQNGNGTLIGGSATTTGRLVLGATNPTNNFGKLWVGGDSYISGNATTTGSMNIGSLIAVACDVKADANGLLYCGTDATGAASGGSNWEAMSWGGTALTPTSTSAGIFVYASSTFNGQLRVNGQSHLMDKVGIGTTTPQFNLTVVDNMAVKNSSNKGSYLGLFKGQGDRPGYATDYYPTLKTDYDHIYFSANNYDLGYLSSPSGDTHFGLKSKTDNESGITTQNTIYLNTNGSSYFDGGKVGIGTTTPEFTLTVHSDMAVKDSTNYGSYFGLFKGVGSLPNYPNASGDYYPTLKTDYSHMYFSVEGYYSGYLGTSAGDTRFALKNSTDSNTLNTIYLNTNGDSYLMGGNVGINDKTPSAKLDIIQTGYGDAFIVESVDGAKNGIYVKNTGADTTPSNSIEDMEVYMPDTYSASASGQSLYIDSNGKLGTSVSSRRYKTNIADAMATSTDWIYQLQPVYFNYKSDLNAPYKQLGLIAEDVYNSAPQLVAYEKDGKTIRSVNYASPYMITALLAEIQNNKKAIDALKVEVGSQATTTLSVMDAITVNQLTVSQAATFYGTITVVGEARFEHKVVFAEDVEIEGKLYVSADQAGIVTVAAGATSTEVKFTGEYAALPIITATPQSDVGLSRYWVESATTTGFRLAVNPILEQEMKFNWHALAVKGMVAGASEIADPEATTTPEVITGCMNPAAANYSPSANQDDGSCIVIVPPAGGGSGDSGSGSGDGAATTTPTVISGCMNSVATNYNPSATADDGSCVVIIPPSGSGSGDSGSGSGDVVEPPAVEPPAETPDVPVTPPASEPAPAPVVEPAPAS